EQIRESIDPHKDYVTVTEIEYPFKIAWHICGYEHFMTLMALNPDLVEALYDRLFEFQTEKAVLAALAGFDIVALVGDIAGQNGMMYSAGMFARFDAPRFKKLTSAVKRANPHTRLLYHSDGDMEEVIPQLIECGIDILNPIQSACMDPARIKRLYGDRLTFHGTISVQDTVPNGSVQDVRDEVSLRLTTVGRDGGFIVSPENSIPYDAPLENVLAIYDTVRQFDCSSLRT
ncbi:MAG TPA: uroporphyrinogen decarboxylase family protein, partial [Spirochaetia bacterium]|nr:uroporphyrinogen decarboxylase family protein [Spirochaetia bacterium]